MTNLPHDGKGPQLLTEGQTTIAVTNSAYSSVSQPESSVKSDKEARAQHKGYEDGARHKGAGISVSFELHILVGVVVLAIILGQCCLIVVRGIMALVLAKLMPKELVKLALPLVLGRSPLRTPSLGHVARRVIVGRSE
jgi:hypothetical protein